MNIRATVITLGKSVAMAAAALVLPVQAFASAPAPSGIWINADSQTQLTINWQSGGGNTAGFYIAFAGGSTPTVCTNGIQIGQRTSYTRSDLSPNSTYSVTVCSYDSRGSVSDGISATATTLGNDSWVPAPTGLFVSSDSQTQSSLQWNSGGGSTIGFYVAFASGTNATVCTNGIQVPNNFYTRSDLDPGSTYTVTVCAYDARGNVSEGIRATQTTQPSDAFVPAPDSLFAQPDNETQLSLEWNSGGGSTAGFYVAFAGGTTATVCANGIKIGLNSHYTRTGLDAGATYTVTVCAYDARGNVSEGISATATMPSGQFSVFPGGRG